MSTLWDPMDYIVQARILEWVAFPFSRGSSQPRDQTQVSQLQADSSLSEPQGKPKDTGVGSLSLLQRIFPTQESNWGLLHCRQILYQLSYEGSPHFTLEFYYICICLAVSMTDAILGPFSSCFLPLTLPRDVLCSKSLHCQGLCS